MRRVFIPECEFYEQELGERTVGVKPSPAFFVVYRVEVFRESPLVDVGEYDVLAGWFGRIMVVLEM